MEQEQVCSIDLFRWNTLGRLRKMPFRSMLVFRGTDGTKRPLCSGGWNNLAIGQNVDLMQPGFGEQPLTGDGLFDEFLRFECLQLSVQRYQGYPGHLRPIAL